MSILADIKQIRERNNLTQKQLSELCGVTLRTVQNWEANKTVPEAIMKYLQTLELNGEIIAPNSRVNSSVEQHVNGDGNKFSGVGDVSDGISAAILQQALNEVTEMRKLLAESLRNTNDLSQRIMSLLETRK